jgi:hypothetical protein
MMGLEPAVREGSLAAQGMMAARLAWLPRAVMSAEPTNQPQIPPERTL